MDDDDYDVPSLIPTTNFFLTISHSSHSLFVIFMDDLTASTTTAAAPTAVTREQSSLFLKCKT
jgi:hypothetical protein